MSTFKKTKVVMLPTNEKSKLVLSFKEKSFNQLIEPKLILLLEEANYQFSNIESEYLYFLSDEEIKEGDWYINTWGDGQPMLCKVNSKEEANDCNRLNYCCKKIIATTDKSLFTETKSIGYTEDRARVFYGKEYLPQPSQSFIEKFVEEYNKGNVITEVMVEYEEGKYNLDELRERHLKGLPHSYDYCNLKINPKDNTITIRKAKDSWNREEVKVILEKAIYERDQFLNKSGTLSYNFDKWIEENL